MSYLNRVFAARFLKTLLIICAIALLIAAIWYLGPFFGFGESRPLESIESRVIFMVLAIFCLVSFWLRWSLFIMATATLCVLIWVLGPFLLAGQQYPLEPIGVRLSIIAGILVIALLYGIWKLLLALKDNPALLDRFTRKKPVPENDTSEVASVIRNAVDYVNKNRGSLSFFQRVILARKPLDVLPWYLMLGTDKSGKTSAILASGQHFPLPEQLNQVGRQGPPTRNCECWFANDAVYVDTAGKYVSSPEKSLPEWRALIRALKKYRPVKAINGVIVTFSAADIMGSTKAELFELAASLRARLEELRQSLGVRFPVYVMVSRMDQLPGFSEYFRILTEQEREQVWGVTFPYGSAMTATVGEFHEQIKEEFALLEQRIEREMIVRQQEEFDNHDRKRMYALPQDFHVLTALMTEVVQNVFFASRYDETQSYTTLRGIYFSSSHQPVDFSLLNNRAIIRKWSNYVENNIPAVVASVEQQPGEQDFLVSDVSYGRQYFLKQLFSEVIVKDADLARHNLTNESKYRLQRLLGHCACILLAVFLLNGFHNSYKNNSSYLRAVDAKVATLSGEVSRFVKTANENFLPRLLTMSQYLPEYGALDVYNPTLDWRYGLYTGHDVVNASGTLYQFFLERLMVPQIERQVTQSLQDAIDYDKPAQIYNRLKLYLMVFGKGKFDKTFMIEQITNLWEESGKLQPYQERRIFITHLNNLFASAEWRRYGQQADEGMVKYARAILDRVDITGRLYERVKSSVAQDVPADLTLNDLTKSRGGELFSFADADGATSIPGLFTRAGYYEQFKKKVDAGLVLLEREDAWVMGRKEGGAKSAALPRMRLTENGALVSPVQEQILTLYLDEYTHHWQEFLANIRIKTDVLALDYGNAGLASEIYMLRTLSATDSPLVRLVQRVVDETTLSGKEEKSLLDNISNKGRILNAASRVSLAYAALEKKLLWAHVDSHFAPLREFVTGSTRPVMEPHMAATGTELSKLMGVLNEQYTLFVIYDDALKSGNTLALSNSALKLSAESQAWPDPLRNLISPLLDGAYHRASDEAIARSNEGIEDSLGRVCRTTLAGRYPFTDSQKEVKLADFERFFAVDGLADEYYKKHLADKVDASSKPWRYKGGMQGDDTGDLAVFEQAAAIRNAFFQGDGRKMLLNLGLSVPYMDPTVTQLNMNFDGEQVNYIHGPVAPVALSWPGSRLGARITISATPRSDSGSSTMMFTGPWALFRWLEDARKIIATSTGETVLVYSLGKRRAEIEITGLTFDDELAVDLLRDFRCPGDY